MEASAINAIRPAMLEAALSFQWPHDERGGPIITQPVLERLIDTVLAGTFAEMFGIVAGLAEVADWQLQHIGKCDPIKICLPEGLLERAHALNVKLTAPVQSEADMICDLLKRAEAK